MPKNVKTEQLKEKIKSIKNEEMKSNIEKDLERKQQKYVKK